MSFKTRLFLTLWLAGMAGILSFLLVDLGALLTQLPVPAGREVPHVTPALKLLSLIQPTVLLSVAVLIGVVLAPKEFQRFITLYAVTLRPAFHWISRTSSSF